MKIYTSTQEEQTRLAIVVSFISNLFITHEVIWVWYIKHVQDDINLPFGNVFKKELS